MEKNTGFSLIELVIVIVILGILSAIATPKFINLTDEALQAKVEANAASLSSGVKMAHLKWQILGSPSIIEQRDNVQLYGNDASGQVDFNVQGFPAQSYSGFDNEISTSNNADCISLWGVLLQNGGNTLAIDESADFISEYNYNEGCIYRLTKKPSYGFLYNSITGEVTTL